MSDPAAGAFASMLGADAVIATAIGTTVQAAAMKAEGAEAGDVGKSALISMASGFAMQGLQEAGVFGGVANTNAGGSDSLYLNEAVTQEAVDLGTGIRSGVDKNFGKTELEPPLQNSLNSPQNSDDKQLSLQLGQQLRHLNSLCLS